MSDPLPRTAHRTAHELYTRRHKLTHTTIQAHENSMRIATGRHERDQRRQLLAATHARQPSVHRLRSRNSLSFLGWDCKASYVPHESPARETPPGILLSQSPNRSAAQWTTRTTAATRLGRRLLCSRCQTRTLFHTLWRRAPNVHASQLHMRKWHAAKSSFMPGKERHRNRLTRVKPGQCVKSSLLSATNLVTGSPGCRRRAGSCGFCPLRLCATLPSSRST